MQQLNTRVIDFRSSSMRQPWRRRCSVGLVRMLHCAVVLAETWRPIGFWEGTAVDELAGAPALTLAQLPCNAQPLHLATIFKLPNPLHRAAFLGAL